MSYRVFVKINRGIMDATAVCVFPWELPLLEEAHGGSVVQVEIDDMIDKSGKNGVASMKKPKLAINPNAIPAKSQREQLLDLCKVSPEDDPVGDPDSEWARLGEKYGMHPEIKMLVTEKVYGNIMGFRRVLRHFKGQTPPPNVDDILPTRSGGAEPEQPEKSISEMDREELKSLLASRDVAFSKNATIEKMRELAEMATA